MSQQEPAESVVEARRLMKASQGDALCSAGLFFCFPACIAASPFSYSSLKLLLLVLCCTVHGREKDKEKLVYFKFSTPLLAPHRTGQKGGKQNLGELQLLA
jgi:hypothetical protein